MIITQAKENMKPPYFEFLRTGSKPYVNLLNLEISSEFDIGIKVQKKLELVSGITGYLGNTFSPERFMALSKCDTVCGITDFDSDMLMHDYRFNGGAITLEIEELQTELDFRVVKDRTIVYNLSLHFYDETEEIRITDGFAEYLDKRVKLIHAALECQNKYINAR